MTRLIVAAALTAAAVVGLIVALGHDGEPGNRLTVTIDEATSMHAGQFIRMSGVKVGEIISVEPVQRGARAEIEMAFQDKVWPLPVDSRVELRWSGTVQANARYVALERGTSDEVYENGSTFNPKAFSTPVEFDQLLATFPEPVRRDLTDFLETSGPAIDNGREPFRRALAVAPPALGEAALVLQDVAEQQQALETLITSGDRVLGAVRASEPDVRSLLDGAGGTFAAIADEATSLQQALDGAPGTFANVRDTLGRADSTLAAARTLTGRLAPGVAELRRTARPLADVLATVRRVGPDAIGTLAAARRAAPDLNPLLAKVRSLSPSLESIGTQAVDNLECIRPYSPEIMSFFSNWGDYFRYSDGKDKMIRAQVQNYGPAFTNVSVYTPAQAAQLFPGMAYGFPRPPGEQAGQPWFLEECGAGRDALDPTKDPEARWAGTMPPAVQRLAEVPE